VGDTTSLQATLIAAAQQIEAVQPPTNPTAEIEELVGDKGYHSNDTMTDLQTLEVRTYIAELARGRRNWTEAPEAQAPVYANRRRVRGARGKRLLRRRGELLERPNAHLYETGGMRRTHLRGHRNIFKRLIVHAAGFNLGLLMRALVGVGKPRRLQGAVSALVFGVLGVAKLLTSLWNHDTRHVRRNPGLTMIQQWLTSVPRRLAAEWTLTTDC
jgi:transposase